MLVNPFGKNGFHRFPDFLMKKFARWSQKRLIGDLLRQGVVKDIFNFRNTLPLPDQGRVFEQSHLGFQLGFLARHVFEHPEKKYAPDDSRLLDHPFCFLGKAIQTGKKHSLEGVRHLDVLDQIGDFPDSIFTRQNTALNQRPEDLLDKERIALRLVLNDLQ